MRKFNEIEKKNPFLVPDNYFNNLSETIKDRVKQPIKIHKNYYWLKVAVAAVVSIFIVTTAVLFFNMQSENKTQQFTENSIAVNLIDEHIIVNEIIDDTSDVILEKNSLKNTEPDDVDMDYVAGSSDLESLLAEL